MAAAVGLWLHVEVEETGTFAVEHDLPLPTDRENAIVQAFERLRPADGLTFRIRTEIPLAGGLGSSATAIVAGLAAAAALDGGSTTPRRCCRWRSTSRATRTTSPRRSSAASS